VLNSRLIYSTFIASLRSVCTAFYDIYKLRRILHTWSNLSDRLEKTLSH
jgi:hypothetical protein